MKKIETKVVCRYNTDFITYENPTQNYKPDSLVTVIRDLANEGWWIAIDRKSFVVFQRESNENVESE